MMWPCCKRPDKCKHYIDYRAGLDQDGYDWCHQCAMEHDYFEPIDKEEQNDRNQV